MKTEPLLSCRIHSIGDLALKHVNQLFRPFWLLGSTVISLISTDLYAQIPTTCPNGSPVTLSEYKLADAFPTRGAAFEGEVFDNRSVTLPVKPRDRFFLTSYPVGATPLPAYTDDHLRLSSSLPVGPMAFRYTSADCKTPISQASPVEVTNLFQGPSNPNLQPVTLSGRFSDICGFSVSHTPYYIHVAHCLPQCTDGIDNDGDGAIDLADFSCNGDIRKDDEATPASQCQDGIDNDSDGAIDAADFSCGGNRQKNDEAEPASQCQDGIDNDSDGAIDLADFSCGGNKQRNDEATPKAQCQDGIDNDLDIAIDLVDFSCGGNNQRDDEATPKAQCQDGVDNDMDGAIDLFDLSCLNGIVPPPNRRQNNDEANPKSQCQDGLDNDSDGAIDLADFSCGNDKQKNDETSPASQCQDGLDNDADGAIDLIDFSCQGDKQKNDELLPKSQCYDLVDNDNDGAIDLADFSCANGVLPTNRRQNNDEANPKSQCQDGLDNDSDGAIDLADFSCGNDRQKNDEASPFAQCQDGIDNDSDGAIDLIDFSCQGDKQKNDELLPKSQCYDLIDNDNDGAIDLADFSCANGILSTNRRQNNDEANPKSQCQDGIDNDADGATDLADFSCGNNKQKNDEASPASQCQDGIDNDSDGAIDLADLGCLNDKQRNDESGLKSQCQDGIDNDNDGLIDQADPGCANQQDNDETGEPSLLSIGLECVFDNYDGSYTAYFGFENLTSGTLGVTSDAQLSSVNEFSPGTPNRGQSMSFVPGRQKGTVAVRFDGTPLTWRVRAKGSALSVATASRTSTPCQRLQPLVGCIDSSPRGLTVSLGYLNPNPFAIQIPIGDLNTFSSVPQDRGQPTTFLSGRNSNAFTIDFSQSVNWSLDGKTAVATRQTPICLNGCIDTPVVSVKKELNQTAIKLAELVNQAAKRLQKLSKKRSSKSIGKLDPKRLNLDAKRAIKKAAQLSARARGIALSFPEIIRTCASTPKLCQSVDNAADLATLSGLFDDLVDQVLRVVARGSFNATGATSRNHPLVVAARAIRSQGDVEISKIPNLTTVCG